MKKSGFVKEMKRCGLILMTGIVLLAVMNSCRKDDNDIEITGPLGDSPVHSGMYMFLYSTDDDGYYQTVNVGNCFGSQICDGSGIDKWYYATGVQVGVNQFVAFHAKHHYEFSHGKEFSIRQILPGGIMGDETESQNWESNYETFFGFQVGNRGFIFGQDSYEQDRRWFIQEIYSNGTLAPNEASNGTWNNYYDYATPLYVNGETYLFFQNESSKYWFITHVDDDLTLNDVSDGHWGEYWETLTSVEIDGNTYLIGERENASPPEWFIQRINSNGTMGEETDRGTWNNYYSNQVAYTLGSKAYLFGSQGTGTSEFLYYFQEIAANGNMGVETWHGNMGRYDAVIPFKLYDKPGSFRYTIGWDMSKTTGAPTRSWSTRYDDPWAGYIKMGGGAGLANIDGDSHNKLDAVLVGIKDLAGADQFYYKVAWNLDATGKAASLTETLSGPQIGEGQAGAGADITDIDNNGLYDLILMVVDDPEGANSFRYHIGWNLNSHGIPASWSNMKQGPTIGSFDSGGGAAVGDIDKNGRPDLVFTAIDNPDGDDSFWMVIGKNLDINGIAQSWTPKIILPCDIGWVSAGGGAALADIDKNGKLDLVLMNIDSPIGANYLWSYVGWDIDINGNFSRWTEIASPASPGNITSGGGAAIGDIDLNGTPDLFLMTVDNPYGND